MTINESVVANPSAEQRRRRVLLADDHAIIRDGLRRLLDGTAGLQCGAEARNGAEVLAKLGAEAFDLVITDLTMPETNGLQLIRDIKAFRPALPILVFSMCDELQFGTRSIRAGASGYVTKDSDPGRLLHAIEDVLNGGIAVSPFLARQMASTMGAPTNARASHMTLTDREHEILLALITGDPLTQIGQNFGLSVKTISAHKSNILGKLGVANTAELIAYAIAEGLTAPVGGYRAARPPPR